MSMEPAKKYLCKDCGDECTYDTSGLAPMWKCEGCYAMYDQRGGYLGWSQPKEACPAYSCARPAGHIGLHARKDKRWSLPHVPLPEGVKHDGEKVQLDLLSVPALIGLGNVLTFGAKKYEAHNWRKGMVWSRLIAAALRHLFAFMLGEDTDPESGLPHIDHALCCLMFLSEFQKMKLGTDDRWRKQP